MSLFGFLEFCFLFLFHSKMISTPKCPVLTLSFPGIMETSDRMFLNIPSADCRASVLSSASPHFSGRPVRLWRAGVQSQADWGSIPTSTSALAGWP